MTAQPNQSETGNTPRTAHAPNPLASDTPALKCPACNYTATPRQIASTSGVIRFILTEGRCPVCTLNSLIEGQPEMKTFYD